MQTFSLTDISLHARNSLVQQALGHARSKLPVLEALTKGASYNLGGNMAVFNLGRDRTISAAYHFTACTDEIDRVEFLRCQSERDATELVGKAIQNVVNKLLSLLEQHLVRIIYDAIPGMKTLRADTDRELRSILHGPDTNPPPNHAWSASSHSQAATSHPTQRPHRKSWPTTLASWSAHFGTGPACGNRRRSWYTNVHWEHSAEPQPAKSPTARP